MALTVEIAEAGAGEDTEPELAGEGGAHEASGLVGREAEEDLLEELFQQRRWRWHGRWRLGFRDGKFELFWWSKGEGDGPKSNFFPFSSFLRISFSFFLVRATSP
jgi:hypothetical protein